MSNRPCRLQGHHTECAEHDFWISITIVSHRISSFFFVEATFETHPPIHFRVLVLIGITAELEPVQMELGQKAGRWSYSPHIQKSSINLTCMFAGCRRGPNPTETLLDTIGEKRMYSVNLAYRKESKLLTIILLTLNHNSTFLLDENKNVLCVFHIQRLRDHHKHFPQIW